MISVDSLVNYGAGGSPFGSEILLNVAVGPMYLARSVTLLASVLPCTALITVGTPGVSIDVQYTPDSGATWRAMRQGSSTLCYVDAGGSIRLFNSFQGGANVFFVPVKALAG